MSAREEILAIVISRDRALESLVFGQDEAAAWGPRLVQTMVGLLLVAFPDVHDHPVPEGPHFVYDGQELFLGRRGCGPLMVVWDTGLLIDYFEHGRSMWEGKSLPHEVPGEYGEELEALQLVMATWVMRDIHFRILRRTLADAKRSLSDAQLSQRHVAFEEFTEALTLSPTADEGSPRPPLLLPDSVIDKAVDRVPRGGDRDLVRGAIRLGAHVFLTRDRAVLRTAPHFRPTGLFVASPGDLLEQLFACGALHCLLEPQFAYWPFPDLDRVAHLVHALGVAPEARVPDGSS